jgi:hypothetical protein
MPRTTTFIVQTFSMSAGKRPKLQADNPISFKTRAEAVKRGERALQHQGKQGVIVTEVTGDAGFDDFDDPVLVFKAGQLPRGMGDDD